MQEVVQDYTRQFADVQTALEELIQGSSFTCNVRYMTQNFAGKTWNMQYSKGRGTHGADILPTFFSTYSPLASLIGILNPDIKKSGPRLRSYFVSYITIGDPNAARTLSKAPDMPKPLDSNAETLGPILNVDDDFTLVAGDLDTTLTECDFWNNVITGATNVLGYAPPDAVGQSTIPASNPSGNFFGIGQSLGNSSIAAGIVKTSLKVEKGSNTGNRRRVGATFSLVLLAVFASLV